MIYELAKQLKDAGFPQGKSNDYIFLDGEDWVLPSLSELIEALDVTKFTLVKDTTWMCNTSQLTFSKNGVTLINPSIGNTPEEAVAKLWLELHK